MNSRQPQPWGQRLSNGCVSSEPGIEVKILSINYAAPSAMTAVSGAIDNENMIAS
jgi:hypothetical protein